jgi:hypothetical protein
MGEAVLAQPRVAPFPAPAGDDVAARRGPSGRERPARRTLRAQIARLEAELGDTLLEAFQMRGSGAAARPPACARERASAPVPGTAPRMLDLGELEIIRDELARRLRAARMQNGRLADEQAAARALLARVKLEPGRHRFTRISQAELGEPGCGVWQVRPRLGLIGMLAGWWQVKLSSGCPLAGGVASR